MVVPRTLQTDVGQQFLRKPFCERWPTPPPARGVAQWDASRLTLRFPRRRAAASTVDWRKDACSCNAQLLGGVIDTSSLPSLQCRLRFWGKLPRAALWFHNGRLAGVDYHQQALNFSRA